MAQSALDLQYLSAAFSFPKESFQTLLDVPTTGLVQSLLEQLTDAAKEYSSIQSEKLKSDIQLEAAIRNGESRAKQLKLNAEKSQKEVQEVREKLNESENARGTLESQLQSLKSSSTTSSSDVETLHVRIASLESSNRDTLALLDRKSSAHDRLADELTTQQQKIVALRREVSELEDKLQKAENGSLGAKFREQSLQQEIVLLKKNNEWHEDELKRRTTDHTKFRKEKAAQVAELQRQKEDDTQSIETLRRSESALRARVDDITQKLETSFAKVHTLQEEATKSQDAFRVELDNARRLAELQKQSASTSRARLQDVQETLEQLKEDAGTEIGQLQAEIESERSEKELLELKIQEVETQVETLESELQNARRNASRPATPRRMNGHTGRDSPNMFSSPGASRLKGSLNMTQLYSEHSQLRSDLDAERRRNEKLRSTLDEMIRGLEKKQPEIEEQRLEYERIQVDLTEMTALLETTINERNEYSKATKSLEGEINGLNQETSLLRQQLRDLSMQIKVLLAEAMFQAQGLPALSPTDKTLLEQAINGQIDTADLEGMSDTGRLISERLIVFRNVDELQEQNVRLGHLTRQLGEEMEGAEAQAKRQQQEQDQKELEETRERVIRYQDEIKSLTIRSESYIRERDMYRRMLSHRGQLPADANLPDMFGQSLNASAMGASSADPAAAASNGDSSKDLADYNRLLKEMQKQYDNYRQEASAEYATLKEQLTRSAKEKSDIQSELAKASSQVTLSRERYELLQSNLAMVKNENGELQKRSTSLAEVAARQDLRTQQVAEELVEARSLTEGLRNENANLKAERELWKKIESRIGEDNQQLLEERSRLNKMLTDLQSLQNERELTDSEARRRLQSRIDTLDTELQTTKRKLEEEAEDNKKAVMRREYEQEQNRSRIEDLLKSLGNTREELVAAKTTRDQSQARVDELTVELRAAHQKAEALQPLLTSGRQTNGSSEDQENRLSAEQELTIQVSDLQRDLDLAKNEIHQASQHVDQYKNISQAAEEELQTLTETHDEFKAEMDRIVLEKESKIQDLESRVGEISAELATTNIELSELKDLQGSASSVFDEQKALLEQDIARFRDESERFAETARLHQEDLKAQAEIAQNAQQSYEDELVKHAEAAKALQTIRAEHNQLKTEVAGYKADAEASKASLSNSEESWAEARTRYENELAELRARREDVNAQNRRLHQQLEATSAQIEELKRSRPSTGAAENASTALSDAKSNREDIINWLKKEKEIVEVQLELSIQEGNRHKQKLEYTENQLDEVREKLSQERQSQSDRDRTNMSHSKLMESINQLNLFRESNASLRSEAQLARTQLAERTKQVESLTQQIEPLRTRVREVENDLENKDGEIKLLQEDRDRLQKRIQDIFSRHQRIDPAELEQLKTRVTDLETERDALVAEKQVLQTSVDGIEEQIKQATTKLSSEFEERRLKLIDSAKAKAREQGAVIRDKNQQIEDLQKEKTQADAELESAKADLVTAREELNSAVANAANQDHEEGQVDENASSTSVIDAAAQVAAAEGRVQEEQQKFVSLQRDYEALDVVIKALETQVSELQQQLQASQNEVQRLQEAGNTAQPTSADPDLERLRAELETAKQELNAARAAAAVADAQPTASAESAAPIISEEMLEERVAERRAELEAVYKEKETILDVKFDARSEKMKTQLNAKLQESRDRTNRQLEEQKAAHMAEIEKLKASVVQPSTPSQAGPAPAEQTVKAEESPADESKSDPTANMTEKQVQALVASNPTILEMIKRNVQSKVKQAQENLKVEFEKKTAETQATFDQQKKEAVDAARVLEGKKSNVRISMTEKRVAGAQAKLDVIETAARDTPQRPVSEVWNIAKDAKPAVAAPGDTTQPKTAAIPQQKQQPQQQSSTPATNPFGGQPAASAGPNPFGAPANGPPAGSTVANPFATRGPSISGTSGIPSSLPVKPPQGRGQTQPNAGGSGIPRPGSAAGFHNPQSGRGGSAIPRGGGRGGINARGGGNQRGGHNNQRGGHQQNTPASPNTLNPSAAQFAPPNSNIPGPGTKRPHDGGGGNVEKRPKQ